MVEKWRWQFPKTVFVTYEKIQYFKIREEVEEAYQEKLHNNPEKEASELMDIVQAVETRLHQLNLSDEKLGEIKAAHNEKDRARGYYLE